MKNSKAALIGCGLVSELAGVVLIAKSAASNSSPALGIALLAFGVIVMVIGIAAKSKASHTRPNY